MELESSDLSKQRVRQPFTPGWHVESNVPEHLPIKTKKGGVIRRKKKMVEISADMDHSTSAMVETDAQDDFRVEPDSYQRKRCKIASLCERILESPETAFSTRYQLANDDNQPEQSLIDELGQFCYDMDPEICHLALLSAAIAFADLRPSYRIRLPTEKEKEQRTKQGTAKVLKFERSFLSSYKKFVFMLISNVKSSKNPQISIASLRCLIKLLQTMPSFNYGKEILTVIVENLMKESTMMMSVGCISRLFETDQMNDMTFEAVHLISGIMNRHAYHVPSEIIDVFAHLSSSSTGMTRFDDVIHEAMMIYIMAVSHWKNIKPSLLMKLNMTMTKFFPCISMPILTELSTLMRNIIDSDDVSISVLLSSLLAELKCSELLSLSDDEKMLKLLLNDCISIDHYHHIPSILLVVNQWLSLNFSSSHIDLVCALVHRLASLSLHVEVSEANQIRLVIQRICRKYPAIQTVFRESTERFCVDSYDGLTGVNSMTSTNWASSLTSVLLK